MDQKNNLVFGMFASESYVSTNKLKHEKSRETLESDLRTFPCKLLTFLVNKQYISRLYMKFKSNHKKGNILKEMPSFVEIYTFFL